jgi:hypothetical protein
MSTTYIEPEDIAIINRKLLEDFGKLEDKPKFRIVWSDSQLEHRKMFHVAGIQLIYPEIREVEKYPYAKSMWILEQWVPHLGNQEIVSVSGGSYEPVWTFRDSKGTGLRPVYPAAELIALAAEGRLAEKRSLKDAEDDDARALEAEIEGFEEEIKDAGRNYGNQTDAFVAPIFVDSTKVFKG